MSVKRLTPLPALSGVAASQTATLDVPVGPRYHQIIFRGHATIGGVVTDDFASLVTEMRIKINGKVQRVCTPAEAQAILSVMDENGAYGLLTNQTGDYAYWPVYFAEPWRKHLAAQDGLAWATGDVATFQIELDLVAASTVWTLDAWALVDNSVVTGKDNTSQQAPLGLINKWFRTYIPVTGTTVEFSGFPKRDYYQSIHLFDSQDDITQVVVKADNFVIRDHPIGILETNLKTYGMGVGTTGDHIIFDNDDILDSALPMTANGKAVQDFRLQLTLSDGTARNIVAVYQTLGGAE
jgi:hypothetical protein